MQKRKELDWATIDGVLQFNATKPQCAKILDVSEDTIDRRIKEKHKQTFQEYKETQMGLTKISLQQKAIQMALAGHATMLIFCLKNLCEWKDNPEMVQDSNIQIVVTSNKKDES